nr:MAG TPA: hypothetical protein [Caudoviricetes sp.]DAN47628.1 MAG TPA: hypothetical protein [Caudoviricetes sp.]
MKKFSTAAGVTVAVALFSGSPLIAREAEIASTVPPVGIAIFAPNEILNRALH